jgi:hypothetical protein
VQRKDIVIVTPALAEANNGNRQTTHRRFRMLQGCHRARLAAAWGDGDEAAELRQKPRASIKVQLAPEYPGSTA